MNQVVGKSNEDQENEDVEVTLEESSDSEGKVEVSASEDSGLMAKSLMTIVKEFKNVLKTLRIAIVKKSEIVRKLFVSRKP